MILRRLRRRWSPAKEDRLVDLRVRLNLYRDIETAILTGKPYAYTVGPRNKTNYPMKLDDLRKAIRDIEAEIAQLEDEKAGGGHMTRNVIPRDV